MRTTPSTRPRYDTGGHRDWILAGLEVAGGVHCVPLTYLMVMASAITEAVLLDDDTGVLEVVEVVLADELTSSLVEVVRAARALEE